MTDWIALPERQRQQQNAIWELVQTEVAYIRTLKVITDVRTVAAKRTRATNSLKNLHDISL